MSPKEFLRDSLRQQLTSLQPQRRHSESASLARLLAARLPREAVVATFAALVSEPDLSSLHQLRPDLDLLYPRCLPGRQMQFHLIRDPAELIAGFANIPEPPESSPSPDSALITHVLCPGLAFTLAGARLGQGGGFYDRWLPYASRAHRLGICFTLQLVGTLPTESHDLMMDEVLTSDAPDGSTDSSLSET